MISGVSSTSTGSSSTSDTKATSASDMQDQFLTLLVAQLQNQDPTQPMDNAQMTSQMAQISTVSGIEKLNSTVQSVTSQFASMQMLQGATMIGRTVLSEGNTLSLSSEGKGTAAFDLQGPASNATVTITTATGQVVDTLDLGAAAAGRNYFTWDGSKYAGDKSQLRYSVQAKNGDTSVSATALSPQLIVGATVNNNNLQLELSNGKNISYTDVKTIY